MLLCDTSRPNTCLIPINPKSRFFQVREGKREEGRGRGKREEREKIYLDIVISTTKIGE